MTTRLTRAFALACLAAGTLASARAETSEEFHQTYALSEGGRFSLHNVNGTVRVRAWDRSQVQVHAVKYARNARDLAELKIEVEARADALVIRTRHPQRKSGWFGTRGSADRVEYTVQVPRATRLDDVQSVNGAVEIDGVAGRIKASTVNGSLTARHLAQAAELSTVNGRLAASFDRLPGDASVRASTVNGKATLALPRDASAKIEARTVNGAIRTDFELKVNGRLGTGKTLEATLGGGDADLHISTVNGSIELVETAPANL